MEAPARRRARLRAAFVALSTVCSLLFMLSPAAYAEPDPEQTTEAPTDPPVTTDPPAPTVEPTTEASPPPTTEAPPPPPKVRKFALTVSDVVLGDGYWQGDGSSKLVVSVQNLGDVPETITGFYTFPSGTRATGGYGTDGCTTSNGTLSFSCPLAPGKIGHVVVNVDVALDAWRLSGSGNVTAVMENFPQKVRNFSITFSTKPPVPGIELMADPMTLPVQTTPRTENATLQVKLRNTGSAKAAGAVEVVTPPGVDVVSFPSACKVKKKLTPERDRCELGDIAAGKDVSASFVLSISASARAEVPLTGAVHGYLAPIGRDAVETRADYRISGPPLAGESPLPTEAPASPVAVAVAATSDPAKRQRPASGLLTSDPLSSVPFVGGIIGLVALVGFLVVLSLRRRLRDESDVPAAEEELVTVPAQRTSDEDLPALPQRTPIPRSLTLPRLPSGPVAGSSFRKDDE
ncbi:hypothetical protein OHA72_03970 [Dactylosporangium sp. NBC_01737]|uniref:hypothetical protein n=1 Tax=Dactylosporangium sp. NBC_01737 TaxID=2975959 RepID=UPI002E0EC169|nr:hypothetical protein OHA72_03970 [Dactylosporangium sp. NBC_01737]